MKRITLPPKLMAIYQGMETYRQRIGAAYDQILWAGFMLLIGCGLLLSAWPHLSLLSGLALLAMLGALGRGAWNWPALQISTATLLLAAVIILFSGQAGIYFAYICISGLVLLGGGLLLLILVESARTRMSYQHVSAVYWLALLACLLMLLMRWMDRPSVGLYYAGLPLANTLDSLLLLTAVLIFMFVYFLRHHVRGNANSLLALPVTGVGIYVLGRALQSAGAQAMLPAGILEHGLLLLHVPTMVLAFALLIMVSGFALLRLVGDFGWFRARQNKDVIETIHLSLEEYLYRLLSLAIILLGTGIVSGMFWSTLAWGHYWWWEAKQLSSIALWLYYLAAIHLRLQKGMQGRAFAMLCLLGLPLLLMTWMGTNLWTQGLHNFNDA